MYAREIWVGEITDNKFGTSSFSWFCAINRYIWHISYIFKSYLARVKYNFNFYALISVFF